MRTVRFDVFRSLPLPKEFVARYGMYEDGRATVAAEFDGQTWYPMTPGIPVPSLCIWPSLFDAWRADLETWPLWGRELGQGETLNTVGQLAGNAGVKPTADLIDCEGASPCSTCPDKRECGRAGCVRIAQLRNAMNADAGSAAVGGVQETAAGLIERLRAEGYTPDQIAAELAAAGLDSEADAAGLTLATPGVPGTHEGQSDE